jgi:hypothetical protein
MSEGLAIIALLAVSCGEASSFPATRSGQQERTLSTYRIGVSAADPEATVMTVRERGDGGQSQPFLGVFDKLTKWIPSDTLAIYVPGVTLLGASRVSPSILFLIVMIVVTPLFTLGFAFSTGEPLTRTVWVSAALAAVAFAIWSLSVPMNGWQSITLIATNKGAVAVGAALAGILFGYLAEGITKRTFSSRSSLGHQKQDTPRRD